IDADGNAVRLPRRLQHDARSDALAECALGTRACLGYGRRRQPRSARCDVRWIETLPGQLHWRVHRRARPQRVLRSFGGRSVAASTMPPLAQSEGYRHPRPGPDWHVAERDAGRRRGSSGQQLSSAGMADRFWRVACHYEQNGTSDASARLMSNLYDTIVIGAGQAGLASAYYLQRARSPFLVLD